MKRLTETNIANKDLISSTNKLLSHVGITAKPITSMKELKRVASSMFVAIFEALFRTRVEGVVRRPKDTHDYISNCQVILDSLSHQLQMDLRHITGESIFNGDRRAISNLVNILLRIATITGKGSGQNFVKSKGSESISSHESAFAHMEGEVLDNSEVEQVKNSDHSNLKILSEGPDPKSNDEPATDDAHLWEMPFLGAQFGRHYIGGDDSVERNEMRKSFDGPLQDVTPGQAHSLWRSDHHGGFEDELDIANLRSSLKEFEQHKKIEAARKRREDHLKKKVCQANIRNANSAHKSFQAFRQICEEDDRREDYADMLRRKHHEHVMLRNVQKGLIKHMRDGQLAQSVEAKERMQEVRKEARWHFQSLQNLFDDRVKALRKQEVYLRSTQDRDVKSYKVVHDELCRVNSLKHKEALRNNKNAIKQKRLYSSQARRNTHQQLLSYLAVGESWENSLRSSWPPLPLATSSLTAQSEHNYPESHNIKEKRFVYSPKAKTHTSKKKSLVRPKSAPVKYQRIFG